MVDETGKIIGRLQLDNGMELVLYDCSRLMAGDRWLAELACRAYIPIDASCWQIAAAADPQLLPAIRGMLGENLVFSINKKRNFIAAEELEAVLKEMVQQVKSSILEYLKRPDFPRKLFQKQYRDARQKIMIQQAMAQAENSRQEE